MARKIKKRDIDRQLLDALYIVEQEWKQISSIVEKSIEPSMDGKFRESIAQAKYLYLLREARHRNLNALNYK
ncbi:YaaL family protein [Virgibacillus sp. MSJ-26]|uniref:YaaL family protein n=1 Tax=Virgibacillus sp. MSJ-26 TaxID=2841522 RepID=UPI001C122727|nr:YaaL family protein [Virgibacillus sp. MSJ-26]MBU5467434.1 YaaL family protein [Virgibacillus sp. MSJ-26]